MSRHSDLPSIENRGMYYGKFINVKMNGNPNIPGSKVLINEHHVKTYDKLLDTINEKMKPARAIRILYTPDSGTRVSRIDEIESGRLYVAAPSEKFKPLG